VLATLLLIGSLVPLTAMVVTLFAAARIRDGARPQRSRS
jgi:hypothetical protein